MHDASASVEVVVAAGICLNANSARRSFGMSGLVISGGRVVDPASGMDAIGDVAVVDGRIAAVGAALGGAD
ncbi:hypothetical protein MOV75_40960, partial [Bradyrhizobium sp. PRIMUS42]|nr:hypothetical protein [Bradyrhizobium sp. PRIMUS42]